MPWPKPRASSGILRAPKNTKIKTKMTTIGIPPRSNNANMVFIQCSASVSLIRPIVKCQNQLKTKGSAYFVNKLRSSNDHVGRLASLPVREDRQTESEPDLVEGW